jgi:hypothetical protein
MAAAKLTDHLIIQAIKTVSGNTPLTDAKSEKAGGVFLEGVPVMLSTGVVKEWDAAVGAASPTVGIIGISKQPGANLGSDGAGAPSLPFGSVGFPGSSTTFGSVQYETSAVNIPMGAPFSDGRTIYEVAIDDTIFIGQFDNAAGAVDADYTPVIGDLSKEYGLTKDATGHWYVDKNKNTVGANTVVEIVGFDPSMPLGVNSNVLFKFLKAIQQFTH